MLFVVRCDTLLYGFPSLLGLYFAAGHRVRLFKMSLRLNIYYGWQKAPDDS